MNTQSKGLKRRQADYGFARVRDLAFDAVHGLWRQRENEGMKQKDIVETLDRDPAWVSRNLRGPGNWTLRTFGELVTALDGEVEIIVHALGGGQQHGNNYDAYSGYSDLCLKSEPINPAPSREANLLEVGDIIAETVSA